MKRLFLNGLTALLLVGLAGCNKFLQNDAEVQAEKEEKAIQAYLKKLPKFTFEKSQSNSYFTKTVANPTGKEIKIGDEITFYYRISMLGAAPLDSIPEASGKPAVGNFIGTPSLIPVSNLSTMAAILPAMTEVLFRSKEGESMIMLAPSSWGFGESGYEKIPGSASLRIDTKVIKVRDENTRVTEFTDAYLKDKNLMLTQRDADGFNFVVTDAKPAAAIVRTGAPVKVKYTGYLLNGTKFDEGEFSYTPGSGQTVIGFDRAVQKSRVGEKVRTVFPSALGYGTQARGTIPPYAPLAFDIEIVSQ